MEDAIADHTTQTTDISDDIARFAEMGLLNRLLKDQSTGRNIIWASNVFVDKGDSYAPSDEILIGDITGDNAGLIRTRASKAKETQTALTRAHAEVFTPTWIVKKMVDAADEAWWEAHPDATWQDYVLSPRLEITCGEAPYLVSRYDAANGAPIPVDERIGILDRKLRFVNDNTTNQQKWAHWAFKALRSTYGYEFQGDNLLIARINVLATIEEFATQAGYSLTAWSYRQLVEATSRNLWQMDGLTDTVPDMDRPPIVSEWYMEQIPGLEDLLPKKERLESDDAVVQKAQIYDWNNGCKLEYCGLKEESAPMRFDYVIGNPPYQDEAIGANSTFAPPIYHLFIDESYKVGDIVELIHPARFLFNAGNTPKAWNKKMLADPHFKVLFYEEDSHAVFPNTEIKAGVVISYHNKGQVFEPIGVFTKYEPLNSVIRKLTTELKTSSMAKKVVSRTAYRFTDEMHRDYPNAINQLSKGHAYDVSTNVFERLPEVFHDKKPNDGHDYIQILGRENGHRTYKYIRRDYVIPVASLDLYTLLMPSANGNGTFGESLTMPIVATPGVGATETFVSIGGFDTEAEAEAARKYVCSKFARALLGVLKVTQHVTPQKWIYVPLQDFTSASDIDWSQTVANIDQQLYAKYGLSQDEIDFIESHVKEMQ